ncbi:hypothetical protein SAMN04487963_3397 [Marinobacter zhejiangensis]|uniref:DUF1127 domain-containing protein n=2 Tax=Marinobacter zhejiangensis TaxID=488535 RepID=A0A1I4SYX7_9GAMM|nr:hypothetical protein SAMN04487963_3397 [Marinobacter zhejiangensis]
MQSSHAEAKKPLFIPPLEPYEPVTLPSPGKRRMQRIRQILTVWWQRHRSRAQLRRQLREISAFDAERDVGLPAGSLLEEAGKPFWRA